MESPFHGGSNDTPLVVVESVRRNIRDLECVRLGDLIIDVVIDVVVFHQKVRSVQMIIICWLICYFSVKLGIFIKINVV